MGEAKKRKQIARLVYHHTSTLRTNLIWMSGVLELEGQGREPIHPVLGTIKHGASARRPMQQFPAVVWFTSRIDVPKCLLTTSIVAVSDTGDRKEIDLKSDEQMALSLQRIALGFEPQEAGLVKWTEHYGYQTDEGRALNESAVEYGDDPNDWWISERPVDVTLSREVRIAKSIFDTKMIRSDQYLADVHRMVRMCRETEGVFIPPSWLTAKQAGLVASMMNLPVKELEE